MTTRNAVRSPSSRTACRLGRLVGSAFVLASITLTAGTASAQVSPDPGRDGTWRGITNVTAVASLGAALITPRVFYPAPEVTVGWKARWHMSQLAPVMTYATLALVNEVFLKDSVKGQRPGCDDTNYGLTQNCQSYGAPSSHSFVAGSTLGHGLAVFIVDTTKWSDGRVSGVGIATNIAVPLVLGLVTVVGRGYTAASDKQGFENGGQIAAGGLTGLGVGFLTGLMYATMARPECGYSGGLICW